MSAAVATRPLPRSLVKEYRRSKRCPAAGKVTYRTFKKAVRAADRASAFNSERFYAYDCPNCDGFHLSREAPRKAAA